MEETIVSDEEQHPKPMIDKKPAEKIDNAEDMFEKTNQDPSTALEPHKSDEVAAVEEHNRAFPVLEDELERRRSVLNVIPETWNNATLMTQFGEITSKKWNRGVQANRSFTSLQNYGRKRAPAERRRKVGNGCKKQKNKHKPSRYKLPTGICSRCRNLTMYSKGAGGADGRKFSSLNIGRSNLGGHYRSNRTLPRRSLQAKSKKSYTSDRSMGYPDTSQCSLNTYHSFLSIDGEPALYP